MIKFFFVLVACCSLPFAIKAQNNPSFKPPSFIGGNDALKKFIEKNVIYPENAKKNNIQGIVLVGFEVYRDGNITDINIESGLGSGTDEAVMRAVNHFFAFNPATLNGLPVTRHIAIPINFAIINGNGKVSIAPNDSITSVRARIKPDVYYLDGSISDYGFPAGSKETADSYRVISNPDTSANDGLFIVRDFYLNGKPKLIGKSTIKSPNIRPEGSLVHFFENGRRKKIETFSEGKNIGEIISYYPTGSSLYSIEEYTKEGRLFLKACYDSTGTVIADGGKGKWINYDEGFKKIVGKGQIENGVKEGEWRGNLNDSISYTCTYHNGEVVTGISKQKSGIEHKFNKELVNAEYLDGMEAFYRFLGDNIRYPLVAREDNIQGKVFVTFVVEENGKLSDISVLRGIGGGCDEETMRVILLSSGKWKPALKFNMPVRTQYTVPVSYTLQNQ